MPPPEQRRSWRPYGRHSREGMRSVGVPDFVRQVEFQGEGRQRQRRIRFAAGLAALELGHGPIVGSRQSRDGRVIGPRGTTAPTGQQDESQRNGPTHPVLLPLAPAMTNRGHDRTRVLSTRQFHRGSGLLRTRLSGHREPVTGAQNSHVVLHRRQLARHVAGDRWHRSNSDPIASICSAAVSTRAWSSCPVGGERRPPPTPPGRGTSRIDCRTW